MSRLVQRFRLLHLTIICAVLLLLCKAGTIWQALEHAGDDGFVIAVARAENHDPKDAASDTKTGSPASDSEATHGQDSTGEAHASKASDQAGKPARHRPNPQCREIPLENPTFSPEEASLLQQLSKRRDELDERAREIDRREDLLKAAEGKILEKITELKDLKGMLESLIKTNDEQQAAKIRSLVKIYENMKPRDAARIFEQMDMDTLLPVVDNMNERKLAPIMSQMEPAKAKAITVELAHQRDVVENDRPEVKQ